MTQQLEVRKFTAAVREKSQTGDNQWKLSLDIPDLSKNYPTIVNRIPSEDATQMVPGQTYYFSLVKGRLKDGKDPTKEYNYWWEWGKLGAEIMPENAPPPGSAGMMAIPVPAASDARAESIERQVALKVAGELYVGAMAAQVAEPTGGHTALKVAAVEEALALARRLVNYFFGDKS